jgi:HlyD family secretion protein
MPEGSRRVGWSTLILTLVVLIGVGALSFAFLRDKIWPHSGPGNGAADGNLPPRTLVSALGRLEPSGGAISVYALPGERVEEILVKPGDRVKKDQRLARLSGRKDRQEDLRLAQRQREEARVQRAAIEEAGKAQVGLIEAEAEQGEKTREDDLKAQTAKIRALKSQLAVAEAQLKRMQSLDKRRAPLSRQEMEQQELVVRQAREELNAARAMLDKTRVTYDATRATRKARRTAAEAQTREALARVPEVAAEQALTQARRALDQTEVKAPVAGTVLRTIAHVGETTSTAPVLELAAGEGMVVVAEVYETDIRLLEDWLTAGPVDIKAASTALKDVLHGTLRDPDRIARRVARNRLTSLSPRADTDRRVLEVRVDLDSASSREASHFVGLQVTVQFTPKSKP